MTTPDSRLFPFQVEGAKWLAPKTTAILADAMGVGKSAQSIAACDLLDIPSFLVICPGIARQNWLREIAMWQRVPRTMQAIMSSKDEMTAQVVVVSWSLLRSLKILRQLVSHRWPAVICDEAHYVKSSSAFRSAALYGTNFDARKGIASMASRVWLLSGTIMPNNLSELWTHCHALFPDVAEGRSFEGWRNEYCRMIPGTNRIVGMRNEGKLLKLLKPHVLRRTQAQVLPDLPALRLAHVPVRPESLPPMDDLAIEAKAVIEAAILTMRTPGKERQGKIMLEGIDQIHQASLRRWTGIAKAPAVAEYLEMDIRAGMGKFVVFAWHRDVIDILCALLPQTRPLHGSISAKNKQALLDEFQSNQSSFTGLVCQLEVASTSIPLTAATHAIFAEPPWVVAQIEQAIKRLHRQGQTRPVLARLFSLSGSFDEVVVSALTRKAADVMRIQTGLTHT